MGIVFRFDARPAKPFFLFLGFRPEAKVSDSRETFSRLFGMCKPELLSFHISAGDELASDMTLGSVMGQVIRAILRSTVSFSIAGRYLTFSGEFPLSLALGSRGSQGERDLTSSDFTGMSSNPRTTSFQWAVGTVTASLSTI
jgi:hypothetical protein